MIRRVGELCGKTERSEEIAQNILRGFSKLPEADKTLRTLYLIWRKPYMSIGKDTFIHHMLDRCGLENVCAGMIRYPELSTANIQELQPELILLSSEPYPFKEKHIQELQQMVPSARIMLVDGEMFSWYGSRLLKAVPYLDAFVASL